ncbi:hypothetical protein HanOQP8_Chr08g0277351 [Helianthus annuus]|nr:hypothetical protein HanHA89_Chr08g0287801 [Helianthus annuus]KAJ0721604.1 hypothetical protein HanOQP8_Chr08g0277351 [Helianthus annuus]
MRHQVLFDEDEVSGFIKIKTKSQYYPDSRGMREVIYVLCSKNQFNNGVEFKQRIGFSINLEE